MKGRIIYIVMALATVILLSMGAILIVRIFDTSVSPVNVGRPAPSLPERQEPAVVETIIETGAQSPPADLHGNAGLLSPAAGNKSESDTSSRSHSYTPAITRSQSAKAQPDPETAEAKSATGKVVEIAGSAWCINTSGKRRALTLGARIFAHDRISTGSKSRLAVKFSDETTLYLAEKTSAVIDKYFYEPAKKNDCRFSMRFVQGLCRIITGLITTINPDRFKVRTRMATAGIRGCELAFKTTPDRDDIYVIGLAGEKAVRIVTSRRGALTTNIHTGETLAVENDKENVFDISEPRTLVSITRGAEPSTRRVSADEIREIISETSSLQPAFSKLRQAPDSAVFTVKPPDEGK